MNILSAGGLVVITFFVLVCCFIGAIWNLAIDHFRSEGGFTGVLALVTAAALTIFIICAPFVETTQ